MKPEMNKELLKLVSQKYRGSLRTVVDNSTPADWKI